MTIVASAFAFLVSLLVWTVIVWLFFPRKWTKRVTGWMVTRFWPESNAAFVFNMAKEKVNSIKEESAKKKAEKAEAKKPLPVDETQSVAEQHGLRP